MNIPEKKGMAIKKQTLYIVAGPIGNLKDITKRAIETLKQVDFVIAEDIRYSLKLLNHLGIKKKMISYFKPKEKERTPKILKMLTEKCAALITDSGTPLIADPGYYLVKKAIEKGIKIIPLPGPSAFLPALVASGLSSDRFIFLGYAPRKKSELTKFLFDLVTFPHTMIFYESPHRIKRFLQVASVVFGCRKLALVKELTKKNEKIIRGDLLIIEEIFNSEILLGEMVVIIEGCQNHKDTKRSLILNSVEDIYDYFKKNYNIRKNELKKILMKKKNL